MRRTLVDPGAVDEVLARIDADEQPDRVVLRRAVLHLLGQLAERAPGHGIEVRVPPHGAIQCGQGPKHTRGTPPNVVEMDATTWVLLATGRLSWDRANFSASGVRADLRPWLPLAGEPSSAA
ncbi:MAG: hypothetical protein HOQ05_08875 [Corynebacteriales bacterium]|nr:hypothetical protein [Mycobacteriales bacterium]